MSGTGMQQPEDDLDVLAGEFVLGTLDPAEAAAVAERARHDAALAAAIAAWQERLAPLARLAPPVTPPAAVWQRIAHSARLPQASPVSAGWRAWWDSVALWRWTAGAGFALATALLLLVVLRPPVAPHQAAALLPTHGAGAAFLAEKTPAGGLRLRALQPVAVTADHDLELWALPPGATRPVALGVIPAQAQRLVLSHPAARLTRQTQLMVSLEPKGGSPTGQPTGPVLFAGTLLD